MSRRRITKAHARYIVLAGLLAIGSVLLWHGLTPSAYGAYLGPRSLQLSTSEISATAGYNLSFDITTSGPLGSIQIQFCSNDPLPGDPCTAPAGFDDSGATLSAQSGPTGFVISPASTANEIILTRPTSPATAGTASYDFASITNPSSSGSYFVRLQTFATVDASGPATDFGGIAFAITNNLAVSAEVPPYLLFCTGVTIPGLNCANATGDYIDFGELSMTSARSGSSQMLVATNALNGYVITVDGTTMTSGSNVIPAISSNDVSRPGTGQFGFNLRANNTPAVGSDPTGPGTAVPQPNYNQPNSYLFVPGDTLVTNSGPDNVREFTSSYVVNVPIGQPSGVYVTTLTYICLATF